MRKVYMNNNPLMLLGKEQELGYQAPDFTVVDTELKPVKLSDFLGKVVVINAVPSIDTPVCNIQVSKFNTEVDKFDDVIILSISVDLPFALDRYCAAEGIYNIKTLSDYKDLDFGMKYGLVIEELRLLGRAVFVVDKKGELCYKEYVHELTHEPDYETALMAVKNCLEQ